jgi:D-3-phosphoglycerate dehydrogenase
VAYFHHETKAGRYDRQVGPALRRIAGQTLGIIGLGRIGNEVARRAAAIGMRVIASGRARSADRECGEPMKALLLSDSQPGIQRQPLHELLAESDYVSLHVPLTSETRHLMDAAALARMKPTAFLINTARGGLVDHAALAEALAEGRLAGAALDVQDPEPPDLSQPPLNDPRVIVTPHAAFLSQEALLDLRTRATQQVIDGLCGRTPLHVMNAPR